MTTSKVKEIKNTPREFVGDRGSTWYFTVEMENGDKGEVSRRAENGLNVGDTLIYEVDTSGKYTKLKEDKPKTSGRSSYAAPARISPAVTALTIAKDIVVANIAASAKPLPLDGLGKKITDLAGDLTKWLAENDK